ncbi:helix-turn-helix transcriptional regulator [Saccharothrix xinjiangensis]|uniref:Response regulator transcription factor n=1 Tax=Saccharothrix xinjiangensis TaxID=204798 RepID=A0ABV9Y7E7_9PSEU
MSGGPLIIPGDLAALRGVRVAVRAGDPLSLAALIDSLDAVPGLSAAPAGGRARADVLLLAPAGAVAHVGAERLAGLPAVLLANRLSLPDARHLTRAGVVEVLPRSAFAGGRAARAVLRAATRPVVTAHALLDGFHRARREAAAPVEPAAVRLLPREVDVLRLLAEGFTTARIAAELGYAERTIKNTVYEMTNRTGLRNRSHAIAHAIRAGVI